MLGLQGTPYSDRVFKLEIAVLERYTFELPKKRFFTRIYHIPPEHDSGGCIHCKLLQLILARLDKLQGKAEPHSEEVEWWRTFMVE